MLSPIALTEEQGKQLLEMAKFFYPALQNKAYKEGVVYYGSKEEADVNFCGFYITGNNHLQCSYPIDSMDDSFHEHLIESIHWFEFVMINLADKIFYAKDNCDKETRRMVEYFYFQTLVDATEGEPSGYEHPVNYLYKIFKRVK